MIATFLEWMANTPWSIQLRESLFVWPLTESTHVLSLTLFVGLAVMMDLRLLGFTMKTMPVSEFTGRLLTWTKVGFVIMTVTGVMLFFANPVRYYHNVFFRIKVLMLILAGLNVWWFHTRTEKRIADWDLDPIPPRGARVAAVFSLILWAGVVVTGRMIAYNWFDCDIQPQPDIINWAAGCTVVPPIQ